MNDDRITADRAEFDTSRGIMDRLLAYADSPYLDVYIINTWACNLRCSHCFVSDQLLRRVEPQEYPMAEAADFVRRFLERYPHKYPGSCAYLIGGEALLRKNALTDFVDHFSGLVKDVSMTTNLTVWPKDAESFARMKGVMVSIDGLPADHDAQRGAGMFAKTYANLVKLLKIMPAERVVINAVLPRPGEGMPHDVPSYSREQYMEFMYLMHRAGAKMENVRLGLPSTTARDVEPHPKELLRKGTTFTRPCCAYRYMQSFSIDPDGQVYTSYFRSSVFDPKLGTVKSTIDEIEQAYRRSLDNSHFMRDPKCPTCPALAYCWGGYCVARWKFHPGVNPSSVCDQEAQIRAASEFVAAYGDISPDFGIPTH